MDKPQAQDALTICSFTVPDIATLASHYLPFFRHGGLLIFHTVELTLATPVFLLLELPGQKDAMACNGCIAMVHRQGKDGYVYGVHFARDSAAVNEAIVKLLGRQTPRGPDWQNLFTGQ